MVKTGMTSFWVVNPPKITYPESGHEFTGGDVNIFRNFGFPEDDGCEFGYYNLYLDDEPVDTLQTLTNTRYTINNLEDGNHEFRVEAYYSVNNVQHSSTDSVAFTVRRPESTLDITYPESSGDYFTRGKKITWI
ncbi:hypothetical protein IKI14_06060 [bacterium]|jgi:hypothetical protein|nr:hypothetical protein [bacterium]